MTLSSLIDYLRQWLADIEANHGVNPIIFAVIYFAGVIPFWLSVYKIITGLKSRNFNQVKAFSIILGIIVILPFTYVAIFGYNLPFWFWVVAACIVGYTIYSTIRKVRSVKL